jgi:hypothetical protein
MTNLKDLFSFHFLTYLKIFCFKLLLILSRKGANRNKLKFVLIVLKDLRKYLIS